ncbi:MAG: hypothetical protein CVV58_04680 [Tenericutes bacterium HGW-Tenericutes-3]|nr:MAG: hypothetical protein CVV58_04680 [Tenericutes bacterium HGW-Tenericutes-3]
MARVQTNTSKTNTSNNKSGKVVQKSTVSKKTGMKASPKREPTKNEIRFFTIGMSVIVLTFLVITAVVLIQYFTAEEEVVPYEDYLHISVSDLKYITQEDDYGVFGDFSYFNGKDEYEDLRAVLNSNDFIYVYFYRSTDLDTDIETAINNIEDVDTLALLFIDLDLASSAELFTTAEIAHLNLDSEKDNMFLTFDINAQTFDLQSRVSDILIEINKL